MLRETRTDALIGFVLQNNTMNLAPALGLWLAMISIPEGSRTEVVFPGDKKAYKALHTDTLQDLLAQSHLYASFRSKAILKKAFNIADGEIVTWD